MVFSAFGGVTDSLIEMSALAEKGKETYLDVFEVFRKRHLEAAHTLLSKKRYKSVQEDLNENHEVLKNLLHGIFLVREASPRSMDYVLSFGERNSAFIIAYALRDHGIKADYLDARKVITLTKTSALLKLTLIPLS